MAGCQLIMRALLREERPRIAVFRPAIKTPEFFVLL
jgi:hypothetical protein